MSEAEAEASTQGMETGKDAAAQDIANTTPQPSTRPDTTPTTDTSTTPFTPLFTLLSTAGKTHHPTTHYIFADDPADGPLTTATLDIVDATDSGMKNRYIILDLDESGSKVLHADSLSPDWAVTEAEISPAPTWEDVTGDQRGMMLRIGGVGRGSTERENTGVQDLTTLAMEYEQRMGELQRVVGGFNRGVTDGGRAE